MDFKLHTPYQPSGDQPTAITTLVQNLTIGEKEQILLGATGTGKTYTIAQTIAQNNKPTLVLAHNKTLAGQLYNELKEFFPENAVEYFVSYFDYYQPEAYVPSSDTYIEKDSKTNDEIEKLRYSATTSLLERRDVIVVSSVSCIYGIGSPELYVNQVMTLKVGQEIDRQEFIRKLLDIQYKRNDVAFERGTFRVRGDVIEIIPIHESEKGLRVSFFGDEIEELIEFDVLTGKKISSQTLALVVPANHYVTDKAVLDQAIIDIKAELKDRLQVLHAENKLLEAQRLEQRTQYDIEMLEEIGFCSGIENYSRHLTQRKVDETPYTLIDYFPDDFLFIVDESHVSIPQIGGMYNGDRARKEVLVNYGFRLPSALDNRPLRFSEFEEKVNQIIYVSATPGDYELGRVKQECIAEQVIRPTGLIDPEIQIIPSSGQIDHLMNEIHKVIQNGNRTLITTVTIKMAEDLTRYLQEHGIKATYLHSEISTLERIVILRDLRIGKYDVLVGINLLREGLDLPEVELVAILDADKEGFLRSHRSLIQLIGRAARNSDGYVLMYADKMTKAMTVAIDETKRRRDKQIAYNTLHDITPMTIKKKIHDSIQTIASSSDGKKSKKMKKDELALQIERIEKEMKEAAKLLDFETAAELRDVLIELKGM
ncbi:MAG: excinuclease ABC subunit UvrB [Culicoidibacterales bacterium]